MGLGWPIASGYPTGVGFPDRRCYSSGLELPIGVEIPASTHAWIISGGFIILADEIPRRY